MEIKRSPLVSSRHPDSPPKPRKPEVRISPLRYASDPNRTRARSRVSNDGIGRALTSIETGAATENSSGTGGFGGACTAVCARAICGTAIAESPAAVDVRKPRRERYSRLMVRRRACAVSNHESRTSLILRDAAKMPLLPSERKCVHPRMRHSVSSMDHLIALRMQFAPTTGRGAGSAMGFAAQLGALFGDGA